MTNEQKEHITELRKQGYTYLKISEKLSVSENTIKTYCRRARLAADTEETVPVCKQCGCPITMKDKHKTRLFCSDKCRAAWWYVNRGSKPRTEYHLICAHCGQPFVSSGNKARKYCSHKCYIADRFGGGCDE